MVAKLSDRVGGEEFPRPIVVGENLLYNGNFKVNQEQFAGGQPAAGVYGYDGWLGSPDGLQIQQIVENDSALTGDYAISWEGGTGTASVNGTAGLASGDIVQLTVSGNFSVIVPTDATKIKFEQFAVTPYQEPKTGEQLAVCERYYQEVSNGYLLGAGVTGQRATWPLHVPMRTATYTAAGKNLAPILFFDGASSQSISFLGANYSTVDTVQYDVGLSGALNGFAVMLSDSAPMALDARLYP